MNTKFILSVSVKNYSDKNAISWKTVNYHQQVLTVPMFAKLIKQGYCFCHCFRSENELMRQSEKRDNNFISTQVVFIDIDNSDIPLHDFLERLTKKPTIAYTTPNNYSDKSHWLYRFRLCYLLHEPITSVSIYGHVYDSITQSIYNDLPNFRITDNCGRKASQQFSGNGSGNIELHQLDRVYFVSDFPFENNNVSFSFYKSETEKPIRNSTNIEIVDGEFITDVKRLNPQDLIIKYRERYKYFDRTQLHYKDGFAIVPDDYQEIYRSWYRDVFEKTNGDKINITVIKKHRDGDSRRYKLFIAALIRKKIMPSITYEHLLFNLICERTWYYDNSDSVINNKILSDIAKNVINTPIEEIRLQGRPKKKFVVDKAYCAEHGITPNSMKNIVRKQLKDEEIGNVYDVSLSVSENLSIFKKLGMKIGKTKLYTWCAENGISTKGHNSVVPAFNILLNFSKHQLKLIEQIKGTAHRYFIADNIHEKEILQSQYYDLIKALPEVA